MGFGERILTSWRLGMGGLRVIWNDKTLLGFPAVTVAAVIAIFSLVYMVVGQQLELLIVAIFSNSDGFESSTTFYTLLLIWYFMLAFVAVFMHVALVGAIHISMNERDSSFADGLKVASRFTFSIIVWTFISYTVGFIITLLDLERRCSRIVRMVLGTGWSVITFLVVPLMVVENQNIFNSLRQANRVMEKKWGDNLHPGFSLGWFFLLLNLPLMALCAYFYFTPLQYRAVESVIVVTYFVLTLIILQTSRAVLMVVFYEYAATNKVPQGFSEDFLKSAFIPWAGQLAVVPAPLPAAAPAPAPAPTTVAEQTPVAETAEPPKTAQ